MVKQKANAIAKKACWGKGSPWLHNYTESVKLSRRKSFKFSYGGLCTTHRNLENRSFKVSRRKSFKLSYGGFCRTQKHTHTHTNTEV